MNRPEEVPVLIVGGGGAGLTASMLLATYGVQSWLISATPSTSILPKAHVLNQRTMEVLQDVGVAEAIYAQGTPPQNMSHTAWYLDVAGQEPRAGTLIHKMECWDGGYRDPAWVAASPCRQTNLPQIRLEPVMRAHAEALNPGRVHFSQELIALEQDARGVVATIKDHLTGETYKMRARYLLGCDGGRTVGRLIGVKLVGENDLQREATVHMTADLSRWLRDDDVLIRWIVHSRFGGAMSVLVPMGPNNWGPKSEEWVFHTSYPAAAEADYDTDEKVVAAMRERLGIPGFEPKVHIVTRWRLVGLVAESIKVGRVFLVGDSAHRHPPTGGLGLTSAVHDAQNLCWKLAYVLKGLAGEKLLESYQPERMPAFARNVQRSVENAMNHLRIVAAFGIDAASSPETNRRNALEFWQPGPAGDARRAAVWPALLAQSMEFKEHNVEIGFRARSDAVVPDGTPEPKNLDDIRIYAPSTYPGSLLPHAWVEREGRCVPLRSVAPPSAFTLIAGEDGQAWCEAARQIAQETGTELVAIRVGHAEGDWSDPRLAFLRVREFNRRGAILVRPDRVIGWRSMGAVPEPVTVLRQALGTILARA